jgi:hypothetical protein
MRPTLFDAPRETRTGSRCTDLLPLSRTACLKCGGLTVLSTMSEAALFRHGGYGATRVVTRRACADPDCPGLRIVSVDEVRPST